VARPDRFSTSSLIEQVFPFGYVSTPQKDFKNLSGLDFVVLHAKRIAHSHLRGKILCQLQGFIVNLQGFSIELIRDLDEKYPASKPAIAIQLAQCASHQCIVVVCNYGVIPQRNQTQAQFIDIQEDVRPQLFVQYSSSSPSCIYKTGRFVPIPNGHLIANSYEQKALLKGRGNVPVRSGKKWPNDCETFFYKGKVYAVFNLTDPPSPNQMSFDI
jgi:hypothetical protein